MGAGGWELSLNHLIRGQEPLTQIHITASYLGTFHCWNEVDLYGQPSMDKLFSYLSLNESRQESMLSDPWLVPLCTQGGDNMAIVTCHQTGIRTNLTIRPISGQIIHYWDNLENKIYIPSPQPALKFCQWHQSSSWLGGEASQGGWAAYLLNKSIHHISNAKPDWAEDCRVSTTMILAIKKSSLWLCLLLKWLWRVMTNTS